MSEDNLEYNLQALSTFLLRQILIGLEFTEHSEPQGSPVSSAQVWVFHRPGD